MGSGKAILGENRTNAENVWPIEGLKHNILSVIQLVDFVLNSKGCFIRKKGLKRKVVRGFKTLDNVYVLKGRVSKEMR